MDMIQHHGHADGIARGTAWGGQVGTGEAVIVTLGYAPKHVIVFNMDDALRYEYVQGMPEGMTMKTGSGASVDKGTAIALIEKGFTLSADVSVEGKQLVWYAD